MNRHTRGEIAGRHGLIRGRSLSRLGYAPHMLRMTVVVAVLLAGCKREDARPKELPAETDAQRLALPPGELDHALLTRDAAEKETL